MSIINNLESSSTLFWFSHIGTEYEVKEISGKKVVMFKDERTIFDWDNCNIQIGPSPVKKIRVFIRGHQHRYSKYYNKVVNCTFFYSMDIDAVSAPKEEEYEIGSQRKDLKSLHFKHYLRYGFALDDGYWIWEWKKNYTDIQQSNIYSLYKQIKIILATPEHAPGSVSIISSNSAHTDLDLIPVLYQPAIDELKNFVREIHCFKRYDNDRSSIEVSIMFNNEELRKHKIGNAVYKVIRFLFYGRDVDIETFKIELPLIKDETPYFTFEGIYSNDSGIIEDTIHGDRMRPPPKRIISSYFIDDFHPVVFINTSNHAMAEKDNNNMLWKWEYQPFDEESPVTYGKKSRKKIELQFTPLFTRVSRWIKCKFGNCVK